MSFNNKTYDTLKWIAQYLIPAVGTLYFALSGIWGLPYGEQIVGTLTAVDTFLGILLGISTANYNGDGTFVVDESNEEKDVVRLELYGDPAELKNKSSVTFLIKDEQK